MSTPRIIPFKPEHLAIIRARDATVVSADYISLGRAYEDLGPAFSGECDGEILGSAGIAMFWKGVGEAWVWVPDEVTARPVFFHRSVKQMLEEIKRAKKLVRIQTTVKLHDVAANRWIQRLGFKPEGKMPRYTIEGEDVMRYAIVEPRSSILGRIDVTGEDTPLLAAHG